MCKMSILRDMNLVIYEKLMFTIIPCHKLISLHWLFINPLYMWPCAKAKSKKSKTFGSQRKPKTEKCVQFWIDMSHIGVAERQWVGKCRNYHNGRRGQSLNMICGLITRPGMCNCPSSPVHGNSGPLGLAICINIISEVFSLWNNGMK